MTTKSGAVKLADFGVSMLTSAAKSGKEFAGSPYWMAPEVIQMETPTQASDIWSLGITVIELLTGAPPYIDMNPLSAMYHIASANTMPELPEKISVELRDFLTLCLNMDPNQRPTAAELQKHVFFNSVGKVYYFICTHLYTSTLHSRNMRKRGESKLTIAKRRGRGSKRATILKKVNLSNLSILRSYEDLHKTQTLIEEKRKDIILSIRDNNRLAEEVKRLDKKIELLIKNNITIGVYLSIVF